MSLEIYFSEPVLCHYNYDLSRSWFVHFDVTNGFTGVTVRKQYRGIINKFQKVNERIAAGKSLCKFWKRKLEDGWNPFDVLTERQKLEGMDLREALDFALNDCKKSVSTATYRAYKGCVNAVLTVAGSIEGMPVTAITKQHIKLLLKKCIDKFKWSNKNFNKNKVYLGSVFSRLVDDWEIIAVNPAAKITSLPVAETKKYLAYTDAEKSIIREYLFLHHYRYYVLLMITYHTGIRPKEVLALKIKDVYLLQRTIKIFPDLQLENSKTKSIRQVPINDHLLPFLRELQLENYDPEYYVFGSACLPGKGNGGFGSMKGNVTGAMHPEYFKPSSVKIKRDTITRLWKKIVMKKLGINKYQYAMKHTGCDDKLLAGISLETLRELYGHSSNQMTERYASVLRNIHFKEIEKRSPAF